MLVGVRGGTAGSRVFSRPAGVVPEAKAYGPDMARRPMRPGAWLRQHMGGDLHAMRGDQDAADRFAQDANWLAPGHREECLELSNALIPAPDGRPKLS